jgi:hypothetical protein
MRKNLPEGTGHSKSSGMPCRGFSRLPLFAELEFLSTPPVRNRYENGHTLRQIATEA